MRRLEQLLRDNDHRPYPAYKNLKGRYTFPNYILSVDHVQGDPFASPSKVSIHISGQQAGFPKHLWQEKEKRIACLPEALLPWYENNHRDLPWRRDRDTYHIWVSEIYRNAP